jgi:hypothetical protein
MASGGRVNLGEVLCAQSNLAGLGVLDRLVRIARPAERERDSGLLQRELIATSPQLFPAPDLVRVYPLSGDDPTTHGMLWQSALPSGRALQVVTADLDHDNHREVLVGLWHSDGTGEVFLMRQGAP